MRTPFRLGAGLALCLLLSSCETKSVNPLAAPETARIDTRLVGDWYDKEDEDTFHFTRSDDHWMHVVITPKPPRPGDPPGAINRSPEEYDLFATTIGADQFLNVVVAEKGDDAKVHKSYFFLRYESSGHHVLQMWALSNDAAAAAVQRGKLRGTIHQDPHPLMVGHPPHPDVDVMIEDSSANIRKFFATTGVANLFDGKMAALYPGRPPAK